MYTFKRRQIGRKQMYVREWYAENSSECIRYDYISYDTCIGIYEPNTRKPDRNTLVINGYDIANCSKPGGTLYIGANACYSPTTRRHAVEMVHMVQVLTDCLTFDYYDVKAVCNDGDSRLSTETGLLLRPAIISANLFKRKMNYCFRLNKDYINEMPLIEDGRWYV